MSKIVFEQLKIVCIVEKITHETFQNPYQGCYDKCLSIQFWGQNYAAQSQDIFDRSI